MDLELVKTEIEKILEKNLPASTFKRVWIFRGMGTKNNIGIAFSASDYNINNVRGQLPQLVSLALWNWDDGLELKPQIFGGDGGQIIYRKPNMQDDREKYLAMKSVKIPFRKPKGELKFIYAAIERFCQNWVKTLKENRNELMYQDIVDYDKLLG